MIQPRMHKQLFLDDLAIETKYGLRRTLNKPDRAGPVMRPDRSRGQVSLQAHSPPQWDPHRQVWELWYQSGYRDPDSRPDTQVSFTHYATSTDGLQWDRPALGLHEWNGSRDNNIVPNDDGLQLYHVLRDEREQDPNRRYKALFSDRGSGRLPAVSPDGLRWTMIDVPPIPADDTSRLTYDELGERFVATVKLSTEWGRSVWLSTSDDFNDWTEPELILHADRIDANNSRRRIKKIVEDPAYLTPPIVDRVGYPAQVYEMTVMPYEGLYVAFPVLFNPAGALPPPRGNHNGVNQTELAVSRDLRDWKRVANRDLFLGVLPWDGEVYDTSQILTCGRPVVREDLGEIWVYYNACRFRSWSDQHDESYARVLPGPQLRRPGEGQAGRLRVPGRGEKGHAGHDAVRPGRRRVRERRRPERSASGGAGRRRGHAAPSRVLAVRVRHRERRPPEPRAHVGRAACVPAPAAGAAPVRAEPLQALRLLGRITATPHS